MTATTAGVKMLPPNVISLDDFRRRQQSRPEVWESKPKITTTVISATDLDEMKPAVGKVEVEDLYPGLPDTSQLPTAMRMLDKALEYIQQAAESYEEKDLVAADLQMMSVGTKLAELFSFRSLGDGFGNIVNALIWGLNSRAGIPLESDQMLAVRRCLDAIRETPFLSFDESMDFVELLEDSGLHVESRHLDALIDDAT